MNIGICNMYDFMDRLSDWCQNHHLVVRYYFIENTENGRTAIFLHQDLPLPNWPLRFDLLFDEMDNYDESFAAVTMYLVSQMGPVTKLDDGKVEMKMTGIGTDIKPDGEKDPVNRPDHYTHGMECIDEMLLIFGKEATMHFCLLNAWKYRKRAMYKNGVEDMRKSDWYVDKYRELMDTE